VGRVREIFGKWIRRGTEPPVPQNPLLFTDHEEIKDIARQMARTKVEIDRSILTLRSWARDLSRRVAETVGLGYIGVDVVVAVNVNDGRPVAAIVYKRRAHVINLFVSQTAGYGSGATMEKLQGFTVWSWTWSDLSFRAVSDINAEELREFGDMLETAVQSGN
jgi:hypothetical protein